jgi:GNAT superfamily N-acetyltransferase
MASDMPVTGDVPATCVISTDKGRLDIGYIHAYLSEQSYWARGRSLAKVEKSIEHSLCFGVYCGGRQIGFARVMTDYTLFAWLADVFVDEAWRGHGIGKRLIETVVNHPELSEVRRFVLTTSDAHDLYRRFGFGDLRRPELMMERVQK